MDYNSLQLDNIYASLENVGPIMVVCINRDGGGIIYRNARFERELIAHDGEVANLTIYDFVHDESYIPLARLLNTAKENPGQTADFCFLDKQNKCYEVELNTHANPFDPEQLVLFLTDIREQQERDRSLRVYQQIFSSTEELIALIDTNYRYQVVNRSYLEHHQIAEDTIIGSTLFDLYQEEATDLIKVIDRTLKQGEVVRQLHPYTSPKCKGEILYIDSMHSPYLDQQGKICGVIVSARDITEQYRAEKAMESSQGYYKMLFQYSPDMLASVNIDTGKIIESNHMLSKVMELDDQEVKGTSVFSFHAPPCKERLAGAVAMLNERDAISDLELCLVSSSGEQVSVSLRTTPMVDLERNIAIFVWRDIRKQKQLAHDAVHDTLTSLLNRAGFMEQLDKRFRRSEGKVLCYFDVDNFKTLNDTFGHLMGDKFLIELAAIMNEFMSEETVGRLGGDEFVALLGHNDLEVAERLMESINQSISDLVSSNEQYAKSKLGVSIGITPFSNDESRRVVLQRADNACYESKRTGKHKVTTYEVQVA
jgi:diguanylate cyclase (GGDEF)-like protein/PAS domain S-box-containing protein